MVVIHINERHIKFLFPSQMLDQVQASKATADNSDSGFHHVVFDRDEWEGSSNSLSMPQSGAEIA